MCYSHDESYCLIFFGVVFAGRGLLTQVAGFLAVIFRGSFLRGLISMSAFFPEGGGGGFFNEKLFFKKIVFKKVLEEF